MVKYYLVLSRFVQIGKTYFQEDTMKTISKIIALMMIAIIACFSLASCGEEKKEESTQTATSFHSGDEYANKGDYKKVAVKVEKDNPKSLNKVMKDISKGKYDNKVVEIEGTNNRLGDCCQVIQKDSGKTYAATYYIINSTFPIDYPENGATISLKGLVVVSKKTGARHLEVPKDQIKTVS